jgi:hypothetical protein
MGQKHWNSNEFNTAGATTAAAASNVSLKAAPAAGLSIFITDYMITNEGAANTVQLLDGSGGSAKLMWYVPVNTTFAGHFNVPIKLTAATALCLTTSASDHCVVYVNGFVARSS